MATENESMISPEIEGLLERSAEEGKEGSKFRLVTLGAKRARQMGHATLGSRGSTGI